MTFLGSTFLSQKIQVPSPENRFVHSGSTMGQPGELHSPHAHMGTSGQRHVHIGNASQNTTARLRKVQGGTCGLCAVHTRAGLHSRSVRNDMMHSRAPPVPQRREHNNRAKSSGRHRACEGSSALIISYSICKTRYALCAFF